MRWKGSMWAGVACGAVLAVASGFAVEGAMDTAGAQSGFTVSAEQLRTNQKISQAAVRRSNRSLNYLAPIRTQATDNADTGRDGVKPLNQIPGAGQGWTTSQIANGAITGPKLANGSVTNEKLGPDAVTGAKIAGGTITAANIAPGQVVKGNGSFVSSHQVLATGATDTPVLTLPGVGQLRASCAAGVTTISFLNQSSTAVEVTAWGVNDATALTQQSAALANGLSTTGIASTGTNVLGLTYQVGFVATGNVQQATTAEISAGPSGTSCAVTASGLTTG